jgi:hypothetical protein
LTHTGTCDKESFENGSGREKIQRAPRKEEDGVCKMKLKGPMLETFSAGNV